MRCLGGCLLAVVLSGLLWAGIIFVIIEDVRRGW